MRQLYNIVRARDIESSRGEKKTVWDRVGLLLIDGDKISLRLDTIPVGTWDGWLKAFPRDDTRLGSERPASRSVGFDDLEDDVPF